jgi:DNA-binding LacI/PurR family transcriptional regulator
MGIIKVERHRMQRGILLALSIMLLELETYQNLKQRPRLQKACTELHEMAVELGPGTKFPPMIALRSQLGVSIQTLSDAVRELERRKVIRSVSGVGIYVGESEPRIVTGNIGFMSTVVPDPMDVSEPWQAILAGMRTEGANHNRNVLLIDNDRPFYGWDQVDGVLICDPRHSYDPKAPLQKFPKDLPRVAVYNRIPNVSSVTADDFNGSYLLTQHLISLGHRRIAYLGTVDTKHTLLKQRRAGYMAALEEANINYNENWTCELLWREEWKNNKSEWYNRGGWYFRAAQYFMESWLEQDWQKLGCTALMAQNDEAALGAISALAKAGLSVPHDVSVTGFDGTPRYDSFLLKLTTIRTPFFEIGQTAMRMLSEKIDAFDQNPPSVSLEVQLVEGSTTAAPGRADHYPTQNDSV